MAQDRAGKRRRAGQTTSAKERAKTMAPRRAAHTSHRPESPAILESDDTTDSDPKRIPAQA